MQTSKRHNQNLKKSWLVLISLAVIAVIAALLILLPTRLDNDYYPDPAVSSSGSTLKKTSEKTSVQRVDSPALRSWKQVWGDKDFLVLYRIKREIDLLGFHFIHLESKQAPQQVIIAEHVPDASTGLLFDKATDLELISGLSTQLLALRKASRRDTLTVRSIVPLTAKELDLPFHPYTQRLVSVSIRLSSEKEDRQYTALLLKYPSKAPENAKQTASNFQTVLIAFAKPEIFNTGQVQALLAMLKDTHQHNRPAR